ncbi:MAG: hypothetical protein IT384_00745 [Deltaproteobacteria bacterium]|nr:hypothetical protein [Deltaproteobacteria bacterium]
MVGFKLCLVSYPTTPDETLEAIMSRLSLHDRPAHLLVLRVRGVEHVCELAKHHAQTRGAQIEELDLVGHGKGGMLVLGLQAGGTSKGHVISYRTTHDDLAPVAPHLARGARIRLLGCETARRTEGGQGGLDMLRAVAGVFDGVEVLGMRRPLRAEDFDASGFSAHGALLSSSAAADDSGGGDLADLDLEDDASERHDLLRAAGAEALLRTHGLLAVRGPLELGLVENDLTRGDVRVLVRNGGRGVTLRRGTERRDYVQRGGQAVSDPRLRADLGLDQLSDDPEQLGVAADLAYASLY